MLDDPAPHGRDDTLETPDGPEGEDSSPLDSSLSDDISALFDDGKTYVEAEIAYQKSRFAFAVDRGKSGILYALIAFAVLHLALLALVIGAIIALSPMMTAIGATALVVGLLVLAGGICAIKAKNRFAKLSDAFSANLDTDQSE